ncbi:pleiotropic regulator 1 [Pieris rapae]|uniref:pleiotropic regulator 1 n=1 Tax=Pieris rapae TaxID=64459 RepID=UPI001E27D76D|nr:pleiotropic regulator 1 [Pieris rapae]
MSDDVIKHSVHTLVFRSLKRSHDMFLSNQGMLPPIDDKAENILKVIKSRDSYGLVMSAVQKAQAIKEREAMSRPETPHDTEIAESAALASDGAMLPYTGPAAPTSTAITPLPRKAPVMPKPKWHAPWKLCRVISGHLGWVRCVAVEPGNEWFATGAADRVIKIWDLASGKLKVSLTGHVSTVRGLEVSARHPYLFSCGEDRQVKCWDLEYNKVIRHYHGHLSAVYTLALHPTIDVLLSAGRDGTARVWDMRTKANVHTLTGHTDTVASLVSQASEPQIITGSHDSTIRLWDLAAGKSLCTLTNHKKSVRSIVIHPTLNTFASASPDNIKQWKCPEGKFIQNLSGHNAIVNCMAINPEGVLVSGGDNGTMYLWDWRTGYNFQRLQAAVQPGSMDSEAGIFAMTFDHSGSRLITTEADKTIKIYKEDDTASEETHPINWRPEILKRRKF